jgi:hypothetical protein
VELTVESRPGIAPGSDGFRGPTPTPVTVGFVALLTLFAWLGLYLLSRREVRN